MIIQVLAALAGSIAAGLMFVNGDYALLVGAAFFILLIILWECTNN